MVRGSERCGGEVVRGVEERGALRAFENWSPAFAVGTLLDLVFN